jgi:hypothetical protein
MVGDLVLKWDARREAKGKRGKFDNLWLGPFQVVGVQDNNTYYLVQMDGDLFDVSTIFIHVKYMKVNHGYKAEI